MLRASIGSLFRSPARRSPIRALRSATEGLSSVTRALSGAPWSAGVLPAPSWCLWLRAGRALEFCFSSKGPTTGVGTRCLGCFATRGARGNAGRGHTRVTLDESVVVQRGAENLAEEAKHWGAKCVKARLHCGAQI